MNVLVTEIEYAMPLGIWFLLGMRFAYKFMQDNMHRHSSVGDVIDLSIASIFILAIWPLMMVARLVREH